MTTTPPIGFWHFSFTVADLDRSVEFYCELMRMELVHTQVQDNAYTRRLVGYPDAVLRVAQLRLPGVGLPISGHQLELVQYEEPVLDPGDQEIGRPGAAHLAFAVDDIHEWYARLRRADVQFFSPPNRITAGKNEGGWAVYFRDPDRNVLEALQPPPPLETIKPKS
ncbi:MAG: VOC family protein [Acidimicrobiia bacterium]